MKTIGNKGIHLEQNKQPALSKAIKVIGFDDIVIRKMDHHLPEQPLLLAPYEIVRISKQANIVDESDGKMLWSKLTAAVKNGISSLVIDSIDDEPYISSQLAPMMQYKDQINIGIKLAARAIGAKNIEIQVYKDLFDVEIEMPEQTDIKITRVSGRYPVEYRSRRQQQKSQGLVLGACSLLYLYRAVCLGEMQQGCIITVAGDAVVNPGNYEVPIGTSIMKVLEIVGTISEPKLLVAGGSMTGYSVTMPEAVPVTPTTKGVLAFTHTFRDHNYVCIGCGRCTEVCPINLSPYFIYQVMQDKKRKGINICDADLCTSCGTCSYVCPAKIDLAQTVVACGEIIRKSRGGE